MFALPSLQKAGEALPENPAVEGVCTALHLLLFNELGVRFADLHLLVCANDVPWDLQR